MCEYNCIFLSRFRSERGRGLWDGLLASLPELIPALSMLSLAILTILLAHDREVIYNLPPEVLDAWILPAQRRIAEESGALCLSKQQS